MLKSSKHSCQYSFFEAKVVYAHRESESYVLLSILIKPLQMTSCFPCLKIWLYFLYFEILHSYGSSSTNTQGLTTEARPKEQECQCMKLLTSEYKSLSFLS